MFSSKSTNAATVSKLAETTAPRTTPRQYGGERLDAVRVMVRKLKTQDAVSLPSDLFAETERLTARVDATWTALNQAQDDDRARADAAVDALYRGDVSVDDALTFGEDLMRGRDGSAHAFNIVRRACDHMRDDAVSAGVHAGREAHAVIVSAMNEVLAASNEVDEFHPSAADLLDRYLTLSGLAAETTFKVTALRVPGVSQTLARIHQDRTAEAEEVKAAADLAAARRANAQMLRAHTVLDLGRR